jgi:hypothetical protein
VPSGKNSSIPNNLSRPGVSDGPDVTLRVRQNNEFDETTDGFIAPFIISAPEPDMKGARDEQSNGLYDHGGFCMALYSVSEDCRTEGQGG